MTNEWRPLGLTEDDQSTLFEGVPTWMDHSLWKWLVPYLVFRERADTRLRVELVAEFDRRVRAWDPLSNAIKKGVPVFQQRFVGDEESLLRFVDFCLMKYEQISGGADPEELEEVLLQSGSAWKVGVRKGFSGLERRVPVGVQDAAEHVIAAGGSAGLRLSAAWHAAFGRTPDPSKAYSLAIKAVEDATKPVVSPKDRLATLGKMNNVIRDQKNWSLPLAREDANSPTSEVLLGMMRALWAGQADRHGGDPDPSLTITQEAAEAAVLLAVPLVQWFISGAAARR